MTIESFINHFQEVKNISNDQYMALCPAHNDHNPSLSIRYSDDKSRIRLHCFAGCKTENILDSVGLTTKNLYLTEKEKTVMNKIIYQYFKADGTIAYTKTRTDNTDGTKNFFFEQPNGTKGIKGIQHELYNLPAILSANKVYFVEGEKCANAIIEQGYVATTLDTGAKSPWYSHYNEYLKDKEIIIIPDNDTPGMKYAKMISQNVSTARIVKLPDLAEKGDIYDWLTMGHSITEVDTLPTFEILEDVTVISHNDMENTESFKKETQAETIIRLIEENDTVLFHDTLDEAYAAIMNNGHREIFEIENRKFVSWLNNLYYSNQRKIANKENVNQAKELLIGKALFENEGISLNTRVAQFDTGFWYDLSDSDWKTVKITENDWNIVENPPILFKRYNHQKPQFPPSKDGDIKRLLRYINLRDNHTLFLCWLVCCFVPEIPHAMPIFFGEKGAAKTTVCILLKKLIDPSITETLTIQKDPRSLAVNLQKHWFLPFDNVSRIDEETSDTLCRAITGGSIQQRRLNTNADDYIFTFQKCLALNGINNVANRPDLLDRAILIELCRIEESNRRELRELMSEFDNDIPYILGGIFDTLSKAMKIYPTLKLERLPRMADFARWGYAIGEALGGLGDEFLEQYRVNQNIRNVEVIHSNVVATLIVELMKNKSEWKGLISELHKVLEENFLQCGISGKCKEFPAKPNVLSRKIKEIESNLKEVGISFTIKSKTVGSEITLINEKIPPLPSYQQFLAENRETENDMSEETVEF